MKAAHPFGCAALNFLRFGLRTDGVDGLWARPREPLFLQPARRISKTKKLNLRQSSCHPCSKFAAACSQLKPALNVAPCAFLIQSYIVPETVTVPDLMVT